MNYPVTAAMAGTSDAPNCHRCGSSPVFQWTRRATAEESAAQRAEIAVLQGRKLTDDEIAARYGPLRVAVTGCVQHHLGDDPNEPDSGLELQALLHQAACTGHRECGCAAKEMP